MCHSGWKRGYWLVWKIFERLLSIIVEDPPVRLKIRSWPLTKVFDPYIKSHIEGLSSLTKTVDRFSLGINSEMACGNCINAYVGSLGPKVGLVRYPNVTASKTS